MSRENPPHPRDLCGPHRVDHERTLGLNGTTEECVRCGFDETAEECARCGFDERSRDDSDVDVDTPDVPVPAVFLRERFGGQRKSYTTSEV